jgi:UDP-N-acetylglucosamine acyltransferase
MTAGHIAHNCRIGSGTVIASCSLVAGYVEIEDQAFISGVIGIHQFTKIGRLAMIAGGVRVNVDAPPYFLYGGLYITPTGLNKVGLRRAGFTRADTEPLKTAYQLLYRSNLKQEEALKRIEAEVPTEHTLHLVEFVRRSKRGISRE